MKTSAQVQAQARFEQHVEMADQTEALKRWRDCEHADGSEQEYLLVELAERMGVLMEFLAGAKTPRTLAMRSWCLLYAVRPDLVQYESIQDAANRFEVTQQALCDQLKYFKSKTGFVYANRVGTCTTEKLRKRMDDLNAANRAKSARFQNREQIASPL